MRDDSVFDFDFIVLCFERLIEVRVPVCYLVVAYCWLYCRSLGL